MSMQHPNPDGDLDRLFQSVANLREMIWAEIGRWERDINSVRELVRSVGEASEKRDDDLFGWIANLVSNLHGIPSRPATDQEHEEALALNARNSTPAFEVGDSVEVISGLGEGKTGTITKLFGDGDAVIVRVDDGYSFPIPKATWRIRHVYKKFPVGSRVRSTNSTFAGKVGTVVPYPTDNPVRNDYCLVEFDGESGRWVKMNHHLELVTDEPACDDDEGSVGVQVSIDPFTGRLSLEYFDTRGNDNAAD